MPEPEILFAAIVFGAIGMGAFVYGKRQGLPKPMLIGMALMAYPYFIQETWLVYAVGAGLCILLYLFRE